jgi:hypothetical protein
MKTPKNFDIGITSAATDVTNAYIVASTCAGVILANKTLGGIAKKANIKVPKAVDEQMTQTRSGIPITKFHRSTKIMSQKLAITVRQIARPMIFLGSVSLK